jgi:A/G-specific adenine glycosylase
MARFPTPAALAEATAADALRAWAGLGYNRRAVALQRAARLLVERHDGRVPTDLSALEALPGVGSYTARAVLAIAFGRPVGAVDVNVRRVLTRVASAAETGIAPRTLQAMADALVPTTRSADWAHAVMDLGAMLCRPASPRCGECPARPWCRYARSSGVPGSMSRTAAQRSGRSPTVPFERTTRWLRGWIVRRLADTPDGRWIVVDGPIGAHDAHAVRDALLALEADGLVELAIDRTRARLPARPAVAL